MGPLDTFRMKMQRAIHTMCIYIFYVSYGGSTYHPRH